MGLLDDESLVKKLDKTGMLQSIQDLPDQVKNAYKEVIKFTIPTPYINAKNVVILGMGGSAIGGDLIRDLAESECRIPVSVLRDYTIPAYVNSNSLVIAVSYSGNTEETLSSFTAAAKKGAKLLAISSGGKIAAICRKYRAPMFKIEYGAMPRAALGYLFIPLVGIFQKLGYLEIDASLIEKSYHEIRVYQQKLDMQVPTSQNPAKQLAEKISNKISVFVASGILAQVARRAKDQINENSKAISIFEIMPELCHNVSMGIDYPKELTRQLFFIIMQSKYDHPRNALREKIFFQILHKKGIGYEAIFIDSKAGKLAEMFCNVIFVDYVSYYLAILNNIDPTSIEMINYLKDKLAETPMEND